ncbi:MAG: SGNH/GDSL hydrolase family protein [Bacteroidia bacterium]
MSVGLLISVIVLEIFLRIYNPFSPRLKGNTIVIPANKRYIYKNDRIPGLDEKIIHTKNSLGFRGAEMPANFNRKISIIAVGGSTTECYVINDGKDWPSLVQKNLYKEIPDIWMNNAGFNGHSTFGHNVLLKEHILKLRPDYMMFLVGINDVERDDLVNMDSISLATDLYKGRNWKGKIIDLFELSSTIVNLYYTYEAHTLQIYDVLYTPDSDTLTLSYEQQLAELNKQHKYLKAFKNRLLKLVNLCEVNNVTPILITQPTLLGSGYDSVTRIDYNKVKHLTRNGFVQWLVLEQYNQETRNVGKETNTFVIDLGKKLPKKSVYFYDAIHFTNAGAQKVAEIVAADLLPYLQKKR